MSSRISVIFEPNKRYLRELLIYFFNLKKSAAEAHRLLVKAYGDVREVVVSGFKSLRTVNLTSKTKNVVEGQKCTKMRNWKHYWMKIRAKRKKTCTYIRSDSTNNFLSFEIIMIQKQGNWVPYELKSTNVERWFFTYEMLLARHKRKSFLHRIVTGDEIWIHYDNPKKRKSWGHASTSTAKRNIHGKKLMLCIC